MTHYLQVSGALLLSIILILALKSYCKEIAAVLSIAACCMTAIVALSYLQSVLEFLRHLERLTSLNNDMVETLLKITGIGIITEIFCILNPFLHINLIINAQNMQILHFFTKNLKIHL